MDDVGGFLVVVVAIVLLVFAGNCMGEDRARDDAVRCIVDLRATTDTTAFLLERPGCGPIVQALRES